MLTLRIENNPGEGSLHGVLLSGGTLLASSAEPHVVAGMLLALDAKRFTVELFFGEFGLDTQDRAAGEKRIDARLLGPSTEGEWRFVADTFLTLCDMREEGGDWRARLLAEAEMEVERLPFEDASRFDFEAFRRRT